MKLIYNIPLTIVLVFIACLFSSNALAAPTAKLFPVGDRNFGVTTGPDGNLWFIKPSITPNRISKMTLDGVVTDYIVPDTTNNSSITNITTGPDGNLWFNDLSNDKIGKINPATGDITKYDLHDNEFGPTSITTGPDGNLWFVQPSDGYIGKINPATGDITKYDLNFDPSFGVDAFEFITTGPDGNLWFTNFAYSKIVRMSTNGAATEFTLPDPNSRPYSITTGPDGNLWFTEITGNKIGKITPQGVITEYDAPANSHPVGIVVGPDHNIWASGSGNMSLIKIDMSGHIEEYSFSHLSDIGFMMTTLAIGPDDNIWASDSDGTSSLIQFSGIEKVNSDENNPNNSKESASQTPKSPRTGVSLVAALILTIAALCAVGYELTAGLSRRQDTKKMSNK